MNVKRLRARTTRGGRTTRRQQDLKQLLNIIIFYDEMLQLQQIKFLSRGAIKKSLKH
jgi:hypothetical protein